MSFWGAYRGHFIGSERFIVSTVTEKWAGGPHWHLSDVDSPTLEWIFHSVELGRPALSLSGGEATHTQSGSAATV